MQLPISDNTEVVRRLKGQIEMTKPTRKRLWQQIVRAKALAQARNLPEDSPQRHRLMSMVRQVRSGDPSYLEAQAAKIYWSSWLPELSGFRRNPSGDGLNALLNYGYAVLRAGLARSLVG